VTSQAELQTFLRALPKAELHLHLEGSLAPARVAALAQKYSVAFAPGEIAARYHTRNFPQFLELYKWATSFLREPEDYAALASDVSAALHEQGVVYAEITLSVGIMLLRKQDVAANFRALREVFERRAADGQGPHAQFIFDAVRQFGPEPAMEIARLAVAHRAQGVVAYGLGGDELSLPMSDYREAYRFAASHGLRLVAHAGETGGPEQIQDALEILGAERIGHGIAAIRSSALMNTLAERRIPLEICPTSNLRTSALDIQLNSFNAALREHPLPRLLRRGIPVVLSTDDPTMFHCTLLGEYAACADMGLTRAELVQLARAGFEHAFLPQAARKLLLDEFDAAACQPPQRSAANS